MKTKYLFITLFIILAWIGGHVALEQTCLGSEGTQALLTGEYNGIYKVCKYYDYSDFFPGFKVQNGEFIPNK